MRIAVYLPLVLPFLGLWARPVARRLDPRIATWTLTVSAVLLAVGSSAALGLLAATAAVQIPVVATMGGWSLDVLRQDAPAMLPVSISACVLLAAALGATGWTLWWRARAVWASAREAACLPGTDDLVVVDDPAVSAFTMPRMPGVSGLPGRIVVTTGMLAVLDGDEREVLLAHERAHLEKRHYLFAALARSAAVANPLLRPVADAVDHAVECWADEVAAASCGDRRRTAVAVGKAALAAERTPERGAAVLGILGRSAPGPVPRRVAALLAPPQRTRSLPLVLMALVLGVAALSLVHAVHDLDLLLDLADLY